MRALLSCCDARVVVLVASASPCGTCAPGAVVVAVRYNGARAVSGDIVREVVMRRILRAAAVALLVAAGLGCLGARPAAQADTVTVTSPGNQTTVSGTQVSLQIDATSSEALPLSYSVDGLPPGLYIDPSTGLISGYAFSGGQYEVQVTATDSSGETGSAAFTWAVAAVTVTTPDTQTTPWDTQASLQIHASDSAGLPLSYSAPGLPPGLSINSSTGLISGTTTQQGGWVPTVTVSDTSGASASVRFGWEVVNQVTITDPGLQVTKPGAKVSLQIHASDSPELPLAYQASRLPPGLSTAKCVSPLVAR